MDERCVDGASSEVESPRRRRRRRSRPEFAGAGAIERVRLQSVMQRRWFFSGVFQIYCKLGRFSGTKVEVWF